MDYLGGVSHAVQISPDTSTDREVACPEPTSAADGAELLSRVADTYMLNEA
jgi:hypothetical protein